MEKELSKKYYYSPSNFDNLGRRKGDGMTFRDIIKEFEYDFHEIYSTEYALNLYANSKTMALLAKSNDAAPFLIYGMDLTQGKSFDAIQYMILTSIMRWRNIVQTFMSMVLILPL